MAQRKNSGRASREGCTTDRNASATKRGPGRFHAAGHHKATPPKSKGAPHGFVLHTASEARKERRTQIKAFGRRQGLKAIKYWRSNEPFLDAAAEEPLFA